MSSYNPQGTPSGYRPAGERPGEFRAEPTVPDYANAGQPAPVPPPVPFAVPVGAVAPATNGFAVASLVLGIVALALFLFVWPGIICGILAVIFGALGVSKSRQLQGRGRGMSIAGLWLGAGGFTLSVLMILFFVALFAKGIDEMERFHGSPTRVEYRKSWK